MFRKPIMAITIAAIAATSMSSAASAGNKNFKFGHGWGGHHFNHGHHIKIYQPHYRTSCHYYKKKWQWTGKKYWFKKYKTCLILNY